ncbi:hypothetical protein [Halomarina rubra]|uniref:DUF5667 domain-containing protein n=1 Tax=Halomarina rubra TaxID=2071873 RepID=A0ABD6B140_9EURY|nr:hypothetical protein [Halomarina rubra]
MNRQWVSVVSVLALVVLAAPTSGVVSPPANDSNNTSLGTDISSFMQVSSVEASGEVDRGMFAAAVANAPNETVRQRLLDQRADRLSKRLAAVRQSVESARDSRGARGTVAQSAANARVDALERGVADVESVADRTGTTPPGLTDLRENVRGLGEPPIPPVLDVGDDVDLGGEAAPGGDPPVPVDPNGGSDAGDASDGNSGGGDGAPPSGSGGDGVDVGNGDAGGDANDGSSDGPSVEGGVGVDQDGEVDGPTIEVSSNETSTEDTTALAGPQ